MSTNRPFSKKTSTTYSLVYRPQNDPLINDENAPSQVFTQKTHANAQHYAGNGKIKHRDDLEEEFGLSGEPLPDNVEVAAEHGILFNDQYDYLQHLRDLGQGDGEAAFIEAQTSNKDNRKTKQSLEDALREVRLNDERDDLRSQGGISSGSGSAWRDLPSWQRYQEQQDVPDEIAGFQPDMDPRLREVLEALDDEAYVDEDLEIFDQLAEGGEEIDRDLWETLGEQDDEDGWESDATAKAVNEGFQPQPSVDSALPGADGISTPPPVPDHGDAPPADVHGDGDFLEAMAKSKADDKTAGGLSSLGQRKPPRTAPSAAFTTDTAGIGRRKKRKGALTSSTGFSMTSSALARTEALSTLDSKFDRVLDAYMDDIDEEEEFMDDNASAVTGMSKMTGASKMSFASRTDADSEAPSLVSNAAFTSAMDEFLGSTGKKGKKMKKAGKQGFWGQQSGIDQLNDVRGALGPARLQRAEKV